MFTQGSPNRPCHSLAVINARQCLHWVDCIHYIKSLALLHELSAVCVTCKSEDTGSDWIWSALLDLHHDVQVHSYKLPPSGLPHTLTYFEQWHTHRARAHHPPKPGHKIGQKPGGHHGRDKPPNEAFPSLLGRQLNKSPVPNGNACIVSEQHQDCSAVSVLLQDVTGACIIIADCTCRQCTW